MIKVQHILLLLSVLSIVSAIKGIGLNPIRPLQLNKGSSTKYMFFINPETEILSKAKLKVTFPAEFDMTAIASSLTCMSKSTSYSWTTVACNYDKYHFIYVVAKSMFLLGPSKTSRQLS